MQHYLLLLLVVLVVVLRVSDQPCVCYVAGRIGVQRLVAVVVLTLASSIVLSPLQSALVRNALANAAFYGTNTCNTHTLAYMSPNTSFFGSLPFATNTISKHIQCCIISPMRFIKIACASNNCCNIGLMFISGGLCVHEQCDTEI